MLEQAVDLVREDVYAVGPRDRRQLMRVPAGLKGWLMTMYRVFSRMAALTSARSICQLFAARRGSVVVWHPAWSGVSAVDWYAGEKQMERSREKGATFHLSATT